MLSRLALGTVQFGLDYGITNSIGRVSSDKVRAILKYAKENGIDTLDTASGYGDSEKVLGVAGVNNFQIITKTAPLQSGIDNVLQSFQQSLADLNVACVDGLLVHNMSDVKNRKFDTLYEELNKLKQEGLIDKIGFSTYTPDQVDFLLNNFDFDLIQIPLNVFDTRLIDDGQLKKLKESDVEIHARSIFLQGILLNFNNLPSYFLKWKKEFSSYQNIVGKSGLSLLEYALNFSINVKEVDKVLVGVNNIEQFQEIIKALQKEVDGELLSFEINDVNLLNPSFWKI